MSEAPIDSPEILVVDDDLYLLAAIKQTLVLNGYAVRTFGNPVEALASLPRPTTGAAFDGRS